MINTNKYAYLTMEEFKSTTFFNKTQFLGTEEEVDSDEDLDKDITFAIIRSSSIMNNRCGNRINEMWNTDKASDD